MDAPTKFVAEPSKSLKCPCCDGVFCEPVISIGCGHTFCKRCTQVSSDVDEEPHCPLDQTPFDGSSFVANRALQGQLDELQIYCRHGLMRFDSEEEFVIDETGCPEKIPVSHREEHEMICEYAWVPCPNNSNFCGKFRRKDMEEHLRQCDRHQCSFLSQGCTFVGTQVEVEEHEPFCQSRSRAMAEQSFDDANLQLKVGGNGIHSQVWAKTMQKLADKVSELESDKLSMMLQLKQATSQIKSLKAQVDNLTSAVEQLGVTQLAVVRNQISSQSTSDMMAIYDSQIKKQRSSTSTMLASPPNSAVAALGWGNTNRSEGWKMPFAFKCVGTFRGHSGTIWAMTSRDKFLFSAGADVTIKVWDISDIKNSKGCIHTLFGHRDDIHALCIGNGCLYSAGSDKSIRIWNLSTFEHLRTLEDAHDNIVCSLVYTGKYIFSSSLASIKVWKIDSLELVHSISNLKHWVRALTCDRRREKVFSGSHNTVYIWDSQSFALKGRVDHNHGSVYSLAVTDRYLVMGTYNRNTHLFDVNTFQPVKDLTGHLGTITGMTLNPSGNFLFTCSSDNTVQVWDIFKLLPIQVLSRHEASVNCVTLRGNFLFSGSEDREIKVYSYYQLSENAFLG